MPIAVHSVAEVAPLIDRVRAAAARTVQAMTRLTASEPDVLEVLRQMKFTTMAWHPLEECALHAFLLEEAVVAAERHAAAILSRPGLVRHEFVGEELNRMLGL